MGYRRIPTVHTIDDIGGEEGLVVRMSSIRLGKLRRLMQLTDSESDDGMDEMIALLQENLVSWNLEGEDGQPVPTTVEGIDDQEIAFVMKIIEAWTERMTGTDGPGDLGKDSTAGEKFPGQPLTMEAL